MSAKWWAITIILAVLLVGIGVQAYLISRERNSLQRGLTNLNSRLDSLKAENDSLLAEIRYFSNPENLKKELKSKFNYRDQDEKMMIIVP